jgi:hypothetical protein
MYGVLRDAYETSETRTFAGPTSRGSFYLCGWCGLQSGRQAFLKEFSAFLSRRTGSSTSEAEAEEALKNLAGFVEVLRDWDQTARQAMQTAQSGEKEEDRP